jgi:hypothetical protein
MPSDFITIRAAPFDLPTGGDIDIDIEFPAPGVKANRRAILMFRLSVTGGGSAGGSSSPSVLKATLNGRVIFEEKFFSPGPDRSLHKLVESNTVIPVDNKLTLIRTSGTRTFHLSDLVLFYGI